MALIIIATNISKVEKALHSTFYPGIAPYRHGEVVSIAWAMAFYIIKARAFKDGNKRIALLVTATFMALNGFDLKYSFDEKKGFSELANIINNCAGGVIGIDEVKGWVERHKETPVK